MVRPIAAHAGVCTQRSHSGISSSDGCQGTSTCVQAELCLLADIPDGVVNLIPGKGDIAGAALATHPGIDHVRPAQQASVKFSTLTSNQLLTMYTDK
jgi:Aldehyde dehydrogenase family